MPKYVIAPSIVEKLRSKHGIAEEEVIDCFSNIEYGYLIDTNEAHKTNPPTHWFIAPTNKGTLLCVCFIQDLNKDIHIKTAFEPSKERIKLYNKLSKGT
jgi:hypothetical protein